MAIMSAGPVFAYTGAQETPQSLPSIVRETMSLYFHGPRSSQSLKEFTSRLSVRKEFQKPAGVFVTLSDQGKTRACWGSIYPQHKSIAEETVYATFGALTKEYRFKPIKESELKKLKIQVTVVRGMQAIANTNGVNPFREGLIVRSGGKSGVILPGEARDAYYELVLAKLKAGIKPGEPCQLYKIEAEIYD